MVARQFIAWKRRIHRTRPVGYGMIGVAKKGADKDASHPSRLERECRTYPTNSITPYPTGSIIAVWDVPVCCTDHSTADRSTDCRYHRHRRP